MQNVKMTASKLADMVSLLLSDVVTVDVELVSIEVARVGGAFDCSVSTMADALRIVCSRRGVGDYAPAMEPTEAEAEAHEQATIDAANAYVSPVDAERY